MMSIKRGGVNRAPAQPKPKKSVAGSNGNLGATSRRTNQRMVSQSQSDSSSNVSVGAVDLGIDMSPLMEDMSLDNPDQTLFNLYRDIYWHDATCGCAVDMYATLPFSEYSIGGGTDKQLRPYREAIETLNLRTGFPQITTDHLVTGTYLSSILHSKTDKKFIDLMNHRIDSATISPLPFVSQDPLIDVRVADEIKEVLSRTDSPRIQALVKRLGRGFVDKLMSGSIELDPLGTFYVPRKTFSFGEGVSWFRRVVPIYLIEKNLFRGTLVESGKRQRGIMHIQMGDGDQWTPDVEELEFITDLFQNADLDPLGAIVATRLGVNIDEFRQGGDFWKVTDIWDQTATMKLRALGISESFLSGEAQFAYEAQGAITVFMESLKAFRDYMTRSIFYNKLFPLVSMMNGLAVNANGKVIRKDGLMDGDIEDKLRVMNDGSRLFIPTVHWQKQLSTDADQNKMDMLRSMEEMGVPIPLRAMAAAGGFNLDTLLVDQEEDFAMQRKIYEYKARSDELKSEYNVGGGDDGGFGSFSSASSAESNPSALFGGSSVLGNKARPTFAERNFEDKFEVVGRTKTGKRKYIHNQKRAQAKANDAIYKSLEAMKAQGSSSLTRETATPFQPTKQEAAAMKAGGMM